jgi:hypothetical protein
MTDDEYVEALRRAIYGPTPPIGCFVGGRAADGEIRMVEMTIHADARGRE